ncbi:MAG: hypothetical protein K6E85_17055 [Lachnospiraceae bacterium]|nr:hypothetical protein [Lachnospiraceae bacterium]
MRDIFFEEVRRNSKLISEFVEKNGPDNDKTHYYNMLLFEARDQVINLSIIARKEGLLTLEETAEMMCKTGMEQYLRDMIMLIVDGTDPDLVEELCYSRYFSKGFSGYEGLIFLIYMSGGLALQTGHNPRIIEENIKWLLPDSVTPYVEYIDYRFL